MNKKHFFHPSRHLTKTPQPLSNPLPLQQSRLIHNKFHRPQNHSFTTTNYHLISPKQHPSHNSSNLNLKDIKQTTNYTTCYFSTQANNINIKKQIPFQKHHHYLLHKKSSSLHPKHIEINNNLDRSFSKQKRQKQDSIHTARNLQSGLTKDNIMKYFDQACLELQQKYRTNCQSGHFDQAYQNLVILLNYTVDISRIGWFFKALYTICQFYQILQKYQISLKLYDQLRQASIMSKDYQYLVASLIGIGKCASQVNLISQSITILKKALEYSWLVKSPELQINIYDQLGQNYYKLGDIDRANTFHIKYSNAILQQQDSPLRKLSNQQIDIIQHQNTTQKYEDISQSFLTHLNLPIKQLKQVPPFHPSLFTIRSSLPLSKIKPITQLGYSDSIQDQIKRIFNHWMFEIQGAQPNLQNAIQIQNQKKQYSKQKKFTFIDFKMNQHLRLKGINLPLKSITLYSNKQKSRSVIKDEQTKKIKIKRRTYSCFRSCYICKTPNQLKQKIQVLKNLFKKTILCIHQQLILPI